MVNQLFSPSLVEWLRFQNSSIGFLLPASAVLSLLGLNFVRVIDGQFIVNRRENIQKNNLLEDDPNCGITYSGRDECFWDCEIASM